MGRYRPGMCARSVRGVLAVRGADGKGGGNVIWQQRAAGKGGRLARIAALTGATVVLAAAAAVVNPLGAAASHGMRTGKSAAAAAASTATATSTKSTPTEPRSHGHRRAHSPRGPMPPGADLTGRMVG